MPSTTNGVIWSAIERFSIQGISFILSLIIARLITPGEYGLIGMLTIFMAIAQTFIDSGFGNALIQKKDRSETDYSTVFYFNILIGCACYTLLYFCAPLIAKFYNQPELTLITKFIGLNLILSSFSLVQNTKLMIELNFKRLSKISLISVIISGVIGIYTAYLGWGVWALVFQGLLNNSIRTILLWIIVKWRPLLTFSYSSFIKLFGFGSKLLASSLMHTIYLNLYSLVIGKFYNASDVGFYNRAYSISQYPSINIVTIISRVIYPVQCEHQNDNEWLESSFNSYVGIACYIVFPLMIILAVIAKPLVFLLLTEKWLPCAPLISILCLAYVWYPIMVINNQILNVKGRSDLFLKAEIIKKGAAVAILIATIPLGLYWLCTGIVVYNLLDMVIIVAFSKKVLSTGFVKQAKVILPIVVLNLVAAVASLSSIYFIDYACSNIVLSSWLQIIIGGSIFLTTYYLIGKLIELKEMTLLFSTIKRYKK